MFRYASVLVLTLFVFHLNSISLFSHNTIDYDSLSGPTTSEVSFTMCEGNIFDFNGEEYFAAGVYTQLLVNSTGCDSTLDLTVTPSLNDTVFVSICEGETFNGYTESGVYTDILINPAGCDSIVITSLHVFEKSADTVTSLIFCEGDPLIPSPGTIIHKDSNGCDSIEIIIITIIFSSSNTVFNVSICAGEMFNGHYESGVYTDSLTNSAGCDSIVTTNLVVFEKTADIVTNQTVCEGDPNIPAGGLFTTTYIDLNGCEALETLIYTITPRPRLFINESICRGDTTINGYYEEGVFETILNPANPCDTILTIEVAFLPESDCVSSNAELLTDNNIKVFPNPIVDVCTIESKRPIEKLVIYDSNGKKVHEVNNMTNNHISTSFLDQGIYIFHILSNQQASTFKMVKM